MISFFGSHGLRLSLSALLIIAASTNDAAAQNPAPTSAPTATRKRAYEERGGEFRLNVPPLQALGDQLRKAFPPKREQTSGTTQAPSARNRGISQRTESAEEASETRTTQKVAAADGSPTREPSAEVPVAADEGLATDKAQDAETRAYPVVTDRVRKDAPMSEEARVVFGQATAAFARGDFQDARRLFREAEELAPGHPVVLTNLALAAYRTGDTAQAETSLRKAVANDLNAFDAWLTLGILSIESEQMDSAVAALSQCVLLDPNDYRARTYLGVAFSRLAWYEAAEDQLQRALTLKEDYAEGHFNLAVVYLRRDPAALELARRHYQRALDLGASPDEVIAAMLNAKAATP